MCKLTITQPKGDVICFEIDVITPVVLCLKILFIKSRFEKVPVINMLSVFGMVRLIKYEVWSLTCKV